ncbi:hypothetical protein N7471_011851 [Penicillium samsonianum]|uniref:uncharacterized protein n=1 Tax=Penicillium samsonianum TaxID=1882272 RepID=UPI002548ED10|nr:uncharacterized protein N7471_011851 [Penicillium samsonianum]KAJ6124534.1 hypothetical protein N7471_011851 [Penicillium samsonianum]
MLRSLMQRLSPLTSRPYHKAMGQTWVPTVSRYPEARKRKFGAEFGAAMQLGGILLLDEVSSSVDQKTERIMQETIRTEFKNYTVIAVNHRLGMTRFGDLVRAGNK